MHERLDVVLDRHLVDRREDAAELAVASLEVRSQSIVAISQTSELVVADDLHRTRQVSLRYPVHGRDDRAKRGQQLGGQGERGDDREGQQDGQGEEQHLREGGVNWLAGQDGLERQDHGTEDDQWHDRGEQQGHGQS
jgi:hypothetical protein